MYVLIFDKKKYVNDFIVKLINEKKLYLDDKIIEFGELKKEDIEYIIELGRGVVPIKKEDREKIYKNSERAKELIKKARGVFLIREDLKKQIL